MRTVAVVDDDDLSRRGIESILREDAEVSVAHALTHDEALTAASGWWEVDVVIVDAADERRDDDHFAGVSVVERIRAGQGPQPKVVVITGHFFNDAVRTRMREAGADLFFYRPDVQDAAQLLRVVAHTDEFDAGIPDPLDAEEMFRLGVTSRSRVNDAVRFAQDAGWTADSLDAPGRRPRAFERLRQRFGLVSRLNPVNIDGTPPERDQTAPSRPQIARALEWATRARRKPP